MRVHPLRLAIIALLVAVPALAQQSGKLTVMFDSGIRNGSDIIKAMAIGAQAVLSTSPRLL